MPVNGQNSPWRAFRWNTVWPEAVGLTKGTVPAVDGHSVVPLDGEVVLTRHRSFAIFAVPYTRMVFVIYKWTNL